MGVVDRQGEREEKTISKSDKRECLARP